MAKGWRGILEEESEHQWVAMAGFLVFILIGAVLIQGTSTLPGIDFRSNGLEHSGGDDGRVLHIAYDNDAYVAVIYGSSGAVMVHNDGNGNEANIGGDYDDLLGLSFMTTLDDSSVITSPSDNTLEVVEFEEEAAVQTKILFDNSSGDFSIKDVAIQHGKDTSLWVMVTDEGEYSSLRGFGSIDRTAESVESSTSGSTLTAAMNNNGDISWDSIESLGDGQWVASGLSSYSVNNEDNSPATPVKHPVLGIISWTKAPAAPMLTTFYEFDNGQFHSLLKLNDGSVLAAGTAGTVHIASDAVITEHNYGSIAATTDDEGNAWLFGIIGSESMVRFIDSVPEKVPLALPVPLEIETVGISGDVIQAFGMSPSGEPATYTVDTSAEGSIDSGRGFLNLLFVAISSITMGVMIWTALNRLLKWK